jgi:hypothetical protein
MLLVGSLLVRYKIERKFKSEWLAIFRSSLWQLKGK